MAKEHVKVPINREPKRSLASMFRLACPKWKFRGTRGNDSLLQAFEDNRFLEESLRKNIVRRLQKLRELTPALCAHPGQSFDEIIRAEIREGKLSTPEEIAILEENGLA